MPSSFVVAEAVGTPHCAHVGERCAGEGLQDERAGRPRRARGRSGSTSRLRLADVEELQVAELLPVQAAKTSSSAARRAASVAASVAGVVAGGAAQRRQRAVAPCAPDAQAADGRGAADDALAAGDRRGESHPRRSARSACRARSAGAGVTRSASRAPRARAPAQPWAGRRAHRPARWRRGNHCWTKNDPNRMNISSSVVTPPSSGQASQTPSPAPGEESQDALSCCGVAPLHASPTLPSVQPVGSGARAAEQAGDADRRRRRGRFPLHLGRVGVAVVVERAEGQRALWPGLSTCRPSASAGENCRDDRVVVDEAGVHQAVVRIAVAGLAGGLHRLDDLVDAHRAVLVDVAARAVGHGSGAEGDADARSPARRW